MTILNKINDLNEELKYYVIELSEFAIGEDGNYLRGSGDNLAGYAVRNKESGVVEHTSMLLPAIIFQAEHLDSMLDSLLNKEDTPTLESLPVDDVLPN